MASMLKSLRSLFFTSPLHKDGYKMVLVVRTDIPMGKGKVGAQCAHAALECYRQASSDRSEQLSFRAWLLEGQPKIVLRTPGEPELLKLARDAKKAGLIVAIIRDAGRTQLQPGTISVLGIGPAPKTIVDNLTADLSTVTSAASAIIISEEVTGRIQLQYPGTISVLEIGPASKNVVGNLTADFKFTEMLAKY